MFLERRRGPYRACVHVINWRAGAVSARLGGRRHTHSRNTVSDGGSTWNMHSTSVASVRACDAHRRMTHLVGSQEGLEGHHDELAEHRGGGIATEQVRSLLALVHQRSLSEREGGVGEKDMKLSEWYPPASSHVQLR